MALFRKKSAGGFTLIELLVVIAIIAVLAVVVILTLNPSGLLQESRDSSRMSDAATFKNVMAIYVADVAPTAMGTTTMCYVSETASTTILVPGSTTTPTAVEVPSTTCASFFLTAATATFSNSRAASGTGWVPINFGSISAGTPIAREPVDPLNTNSFFYAYIPGPNSTFKLGMQMESSKYAAGGGSSDVESTDGGSNVNVYESGNNLAL